MQLQAGTQVKKHMTAKHSNLETTVDKISDVYSETNTGLTVVTNSEADSDEDYKDLVRSKVRLNALNELKIRQKGHNKVKHIPFVHLQAPQEYLTSTLFNNKMKKILFNIRCKTLKTIRDNFHKFYHNDIKCKICGTGEIDSQEHLLKCHNVTSKLSPDMLSLWKTVKYEDIFGSPQEQHAVTRVFQSLFKIRLRLLRDM